MERETQILFNGILGLFGGFVLALFAHMVSHLTPVFALKTQMYNTVK